MVEMDVHAWIAPQQVVALLQREGVLASHQAIFRKVALRACSPAFERRNEPVALSYDRLDESGPIGIFVERPANLPHRRVDRGIAVDEHVGAPERRMNPAAIHEGAGVLDEQNQHFHRDLLEAHARAVSAQRERRDIELELSETDAAGHRGGSYGRSAGSSEKLQTASMARYGTSDHDGTSFERMSLDGFPRRLARRRRSYGASVARARITLGFCGGLQRPRRQSNGPDDRGGSCAQRGRAWVDPVVTRRGR